MGEKRDLNNQSILNSFIAYHFAAHSGGKPNQLVTLQFVPQELVTVLLAFCIAFFSGVAPVPRKFFAKIFLYAKSDKIREHITILE